MSRTKKKYTEAFENYWGRAAQDMGRCCAEVGWERHRIKHTAWLAWQAGRKHLLQILEDSRR